MDPNGDITDAFDDEDLKRSIEEGEKGPWKDEQARFRDPKLEELERQLKEPKSRGYRERRLAELQARGIRERRQREQAEGQPHGRRPRAKPTPNNTLDDPTTFGEPATFEATEQWGEPATFSESKPAPQPKPKPKAPGTPKQKAPWNRGDTPTVPPAAGEWPAEPAAFSEARQHPTPDQPATNGRKPLAASAAALAPVADADATPVDEAAAAEAGPIRIPAEDSVLVAYAPSIFAATLVFVAATLVHGSLEGWHQDLVYRAVIAMLVTGILWRRFQSGRLRATTVAVTVYLTTYITSNRLDQPESQVAIFLGLLVVVAGSGLIGVQRDEFGEQTL